MFLRLQSYESLPSRNNSKNELELKTIVFFCEGICTCLVSNARKLTDSVFDSDELGYLCISYNFAGLKSRIVLNILYQCYKVLALVSFFIWQDLLHTSTCDFSLLLSIKESLLLFQKSFVLKCVENGSKKLYVKYLVGLMDWCEQACKERTNHL